MSYFVYSSGTFSYLVCCVFWSVNNSCQMNFRFRLNSTYGKGRLLENHVQENLEVYIAGTSGDAFRGMVQGPLMENHKSKASDCQVRFQIAHLEDSDSSWKILVYVLEALHSGLRSIFACSRGNSLL